MLLGLSVPKRVPQGSFPVQSLGIQGKFVNSAELLGFGAAPVYGYHRFNYGLKDVHELTALIGGFRMYKFHGRSHGLSIHEKP